MSKFLTLSLFLFIHIYICGQVQAQQAGMEFHSDYGLLYPVNLKNFDYYQVKKLRKNIGNICREKPDTIPYDDIYYLSSNLPYEGAFLLVYVKGYQVHAQVLVNYPWQIKQVFYPFKGGLMALDKHNKSISNLNMRFDWEGMPYDSLAQTYTFSNITSSGTIRVSNGHLKQKFSLYNNPYSGYHGNDHHNDGMQYTGFLVKSKPMYKHGDTLKTKFYICEENGKPYHGDATMVIYRDGASKIEKKIPQVSPGAYLFDYAITDSFRLDRDYEMSVYIKERTSEVISATFRVEEYKLRETVYSFEPFSAVYYPDDSLYIMADARDRNDNTVYDAKADVVITLGTVDKIYTKYVHIPETLYTHTYTMMEMSNGILQLPSFLKDRYMADYSVNIKAHFTNSNNEIKEFTKSFRISYAKKPFNYYISNGYIHLLKNSETGDSVTIHPYTATKETAPVKKIAFTDSLLIDPLMQSYILSTPSYTTSFSVSAALLPVTVTGKLGHDTLFLTMRNPDHLPVYMYYVADEEIKPFDPAKDKFIIMPGKKPVYVYWEYTTYTFRTVKTKSFSIRDKDILLTHDLPDKVYPGQKMKVNIQAENIKNEPLAGTNLTFFSYNAAFVNPDVPDVPDFNTSPGVANTSVIGTLTEEPLAGTQFNLDTAWSKKFHLDKNLYYSTLYSEDSVIIKKVKIENSDQSYVKIFGINGFDDIYTPEVVEENDKIVFYNGSIIDHITTNPGTHSWKARFGDNTVRIDPVVTGTDSLTFIFINLDKKQVIGTDTNHEALRDKIKHTYLYIKNSDYRYQSIRYYDHHHTYNIFATQKDEYYIGPFDSLSGIFVDYYSYNQRKTMYNNLVPGLRNAFVKGGITVQDTTKKIFPFETKTQVLNFSTSGITSLHLSKNAWEEQQFDKLYNKFSTYYPRYTWRDDNQMHILQPSLASNAAATLLINLSKNTMYKYRGKTTEFTGLESGDYKVIYIDKDLEPIIEDTFEIVGRGQYYMVLEKNLLFPGKNKDLSKEGTGYGEIKGQVVDETGKPVPYAKIFLSTHGKIVEEGHADLDGYFNMKGKTPEATYQVKVSSIGYGSVSLDKISFHTKDSIRVIIPLGLLLLDEVEIIGKQKPRYGYRYGEASVYADMTDVIESRDMRATEIISRDETYASVNSLESIVVGSIAGVRSSAEIFVDGVKVRESEADGTAILGGIPAKYGDVNGGVLNLGKLHHTNTLPEMIPLELNTIRSAFSDNAIWQPNLITGADGKASCDIKFPDNITAWNSYILAVHPNGLSGQLMTSTKSFKPVTATLYVPDFVIEGDSFEVVNKVMNYTPLPVTCTNRLLIGETLVMVSDTSIRDFFVHQYLLPAGTGDSMTVSFSTTMTGGYMDGEKRTFPVYRKGISIQKGQVFPFWKNTELSIDSVQPGKEISLEVYNGFDDLVTKEADYLLFTYMHGCNEQMSSKLIAAIVAANTTTKKWKKDLYLGQARKMIRLLEKNQNETGGWGWWNKSTTNVFMSLKVAESLSFAEENGLEVKLSTPFEKAIPGLLKHAYNRSDTLNVIKVAGLYKIEKEKLFDLKTIYTMTQPKGLYQELLVMEIKQLYHLPVDLSDLMNKKKQTLFGNYYWGENGYHIYDNASYMTAMALQIMNREHVGQDTLIRIVGYLMEKRYNGHFSNTMISANMSMFFSSYAKNTGKEDPYMIVNKKDTVVIKDTYTKMKISNLSSLKVCTDRLIYAGYSQQVNLPYEAVKNDNFTITNEWLQDGHQVNSISSGKYVTLRTTLRVHKDATYISLEIPIPAGCTYAEKPQSSYYSREVYREYFKDRVVVYYENLPMGTYEINLTLEPRFKGSYSVNNSLAENMYFPQLNGYNALQRVKIK